MIDLYAAPTTNGLRARMALEECGLAYQLHAIDLAKGESKTPQFLAMNPWGQIPAMVDSDGPGGKPLTLFQSTAILMYAAEKSGKLVPKDPAKRPLLLQALMSGSTDVTPNYGSVVALQRVEKHDPSMGAVKNRIRNAFKGWEGLLGSRKFCMGDEYTIADISLYCGYVRCKQNVADTVEGMPNLERWGNEVGARPGIQKALKF